jgi:hypothetical protein
VNDLAWVDPQCHSSKTKVPGRSHLLIVGFVDAKEALTLKLGRIRKVLEMFIAMVRLGFSGFRAAAGGEPSLECHGGCWVDDATTKVS